VGVKVPQALGLGQTQDFGATKKKNCIVYIKKKRKKILIHKIKY
jgi:hypothetical protein